MFRAGEVARVLSTGQRARIVGPGEGRKWRVLLETSSSLPPSNLPDSSGAFLPESLAVRNIFDEDDLHPAHPTVVNTIEARRDRDDMFTKMQEEYKKTPRADYELVDKLRTAIPKIKKFDYRGHWKEGSILDSSYMLSEMRGLWINPTTFTNKEAKALLKAIDAKKPMRKWVNLGHAMTILSQDCTYCGERGFSLECNGVTLRISGKKCPYPKGVPLNQWELNVPSGEIVVANDLRQWFPLPTGDDDIPSVNTVLGRRATSTAYAGVGMAHASVGNSCPGVYKLGEGRYKIANEPQKEYWNGKEYVPYKRKPRFDGKQVASICTDLWWYSICDREEFKRRTKKFKGSLKSAGAEVIKVKPGVYSFTHDDDRRRSPGKNEELFSTFEWVREPDPVKDYLNGWEAAEVNAHAYVRRSIKSWPSLYGVRKSSEFSVEGKYLTWDEMSPGQKVAAWHRVADHLMCVCGNGEDWHEKGFPLALVEPDIEDIPCPKFRWQCHWYPFSERYGGLFEVKNMAPSFVKMAFEVLESVISFGVNVHENQHCRDVNQTRQLMRLALRRYRELSSRYPDLCDPEYKAWVNDGDRADLWVKKFNLGPDQTEKQLEYIESQKWFPDSFAVELDARKLKGGSFSNGATWANAGTASRYAIVSQNKQESFTFWGANASRTVPLYSVALVKKIGTVSHMGEVLIEIEYEYGDPWMMDKEVGKALVQVKEKDAIRPLSEAEYKKLLPQAKKFYKAVV